MRKERRGLNSRSRRKRKALSRINRTLADCTARCAKRHRGRPSCYLVACNILAFWPVGRFPAHRTRRQGPLDYLALGTPVVYLEQTPYARNKALLVLLVALVGPLLFIKSVELLGAF